MPVQQHSGTIRITHFLRHSQSHAEAENQDEQPRVPVFITTSLTVPPWQMLEMSYDAGLSGTEDTPVYVIDFQHVPAGKYQYKFRLGDGDGDGDDGSGGDGDGCWVLDEGAEVGWCGPL